MKFFTHLMGRLHRRAPVQIADPHPPPAEHRGFDRLEIQGVIIEHLEWCVAFNDHLGMEPSDSAQCPALPGAAESGLGRWLAWALEQAEGRHPLLEELRDEYEQFHRLASQALAHARADQMHLASTLLNTDFERRRARVLEILRTLQRR